MKQSPTSFTVRTDGFEGPLELVLDLIERRKLLVNELALAQVTDDFVDHIKKKAEFPVEETANFIQIAATLLLIKSKSLIPDLTLTEEEEQDVKDLERRLALYAKMREAARELAKIFGVSPLFPAPERVPEATFAPSRDLSAGALREALANVLTAREEVEEMPEARVKSMVTIEEMMERLGKRVESAMQLSFKEFARGTKEKVEIIVSFLALLELVKQGAVAAEQFERHGDIRISQASVAGPPRYG